MAYNLNSYLPNFLNYLFLSIKRPQVLIYLEAEKRGNKALYVFQNLFDFVFLQEVSVYFRLVCLQFSSKQQYHLYTFASRSLHNGLRYFLKESSHRGVISIFVLKNFPNSKIRNNFNFWRVTKYSGARINVSVRRHIFLKSDCVTLIIFYSQVVVHSQKLNLLPIFGWDSFFNGLKKLTDTRLRFQFHDIFL